MKITSNMYQPAMFKCMIQNHGLLLMLLKYLRLSSKNYLRTKHFLSLFFPETRSLDTLMTTLVERKTTFTVKTQNTILFEHFALVIFLNVGFRFYFFVRIINEFNF